MYYNFSYEIVAVLLLLLMLWSKMQYFRSDNRVEHMFWGVMALYLVTNSINIVAALCYSDVIPVNDTWMLVIETVYLLLAMYAVHYQFRIVCTRVEFESEVFRVGNFALVALMTILLLVNIGVRFIFEYIDNEFVGYPFFKSIYLVNGVMFVEMAMVIWNRRKLVRRKVAIFSIFMFLFPVVCILIQFLDDRLLLSGVGATAALMMFSFTLGDQDYEELQSTLVRLEQSKAQDVIKKDEIEAAYRVRQRFMETVSEDMRDPIEEISRINQNIREKSTDEHIGEYVSKIDEASQQLLSFVDELLVESKGIKGE